jgi:hypothetical protein
MAWNKYYIFVSNQEKIDFDTTLPKLGLNNYKAVSEVDLYATNKPKTLFVSNYKGYLIFVHPDLVFQFFKDEVTDTEKFFIDNFPNSVIGAIYSNETVGGFGFALIENGQRIRVKHGSDGEIYNDIGNILQEEEAILSQPIFEEEELEEMSEDMDEEELKNYIAFEASYRVPMELTKRFLGERIDVLDGEAVKFTKFER